MTATSLAKIRFTLPHSYVLNVMLPQLKAKTQIQTILLEAEYGDEERYKSWYMNLGPNSKLQDALIVLEPPLFTYCLMASSHRWSEVCSGRLDLWQLPKDEIDSEALAAVTDS
jgi:hypothetical protein